MLLSVGQTEDGKTVYAGVYKFFETHGMPLDTLMGILREKNSIPCWTTFHKEARLAGMKHERILSKLDEVLSDVYGPEFRDHVIKMLRFLQERGLLK